MTDTTDTAALREFLMEQIDHADSYGGKVWLCAEDARLAMSSLDQLEAERQRSASSEEELHKSLHREKAAERKLMAAQEEIAQLKGEQVPVAYTAERWLDTRCKLSVWTDRESAALGVGDNSRLIELFTAQQKPFVLPAVPHDFVLRTGGKQIHFGVNARTGESLWHSRYDGSDLWCGNWYDRTLQELEWECISTLAAIKAAIEASGSIVKDGE